MLQTLKSQIIVDNLDIMDVSIKSGTYEAKNS